MSKENVNIFGCTLKEVILGDSTMTLPNWNDKLILFDKCDEMENIVIEGLQQVEDGKGNTISVCVRRNIISLAGYLCLNENKITVFASLSIPGDISEHTLDCTLATQLFLNPFINVLKNGDKSECIGFGSDQDTQSNDTKVRLALIKNLTGEGFRYSLKPDMFCYWKIGNELSLLIWNSEHKKSIFESDFDKAAKTASMQWKMMYGIKKVYGSEEMLKDDHFVPFCTLNVILFLFLFIFNN